MKLQNIIEHKYYMSTMLIIIFSYSLFHISVPQIGSLSLIFLILGTLPIFIVYKNKIFKTPIMILLILILVTQILSWINSLIYLPEFANTLPTIDRLGKLFIFIFIAYWLKGSIKNITYLWLFFCFGFLMTIISNVDLVTIFQHGFDQPRVDFLIKNTQWDSMLSGTSLLISFALFYNTLISIKFSKTMKVLLLLITFMFILLFTYFVIITQSRQVWLGLFSAMTIGAFSYLFIYKIVNLKIIFTLPIFILSIIFIFTSSHIVQDRIHEESNVVSSIFDTNSSIKMSSIGVRVNSWLDASEWIQKHPLVGLDSEAIPQVIQQSTRFNDILKSRYGHLHNFFIETLVAYGFIGFILILALYYFIIKSISSSSLSTQEKKYHLLISIIFTTYWIVINNFETFSSRSLGVFVHNLIFASFYTFYLTDYLKTDTKST